MGHGGDGSPTIVSGQHRHLLSSLCVNTDPTSVLQPTHEHRASGWLSAVTLIFVFALSVAVIPAVVACVSAYNHAPGEFAAFIDTARLTIDKDVRHHGNDGRILSMEARTRLMKLLHGMQTISGKLRDELQDMVATSDRASTDTNALCSQQGVKLRTGARLMWASRRIALQDQLRRLDHLEIQILLVHSRAYTFGSDSVPSDDMACPHCSVSTQADAGDADSIARSSSGPPKSISFRPPTPPTTPKRSEMASIPKSSSAIERRGGSFRRRFAGVVQELQGSPKLEQRRYKSMELELGVLRIDE